MLMCDAYVELSSNRGIGFGGVGPIPAWAIRQWCEDCELSVDVARHLRTVIRLVDAETLRRQAVEIKARSKAK